MKNLELVVNFFSTEYNNDTGTKHFIDIGKYTETFLHSASGHQ